MRARFEDNIRVESRRVAERRNKVADLERRLSDARLALEREIAQSQQAGQLLPDWPDEGYPLPPAAGEEPALAAACPGEEDPPGYEPGGFADALHLADDRTEVLVSHGRLSAQQGRLARWHKTAIAVVSGATGIAVMVALLTSGGAAWPATVARMQAQISEACANPDVKSEPGQVNFACGKGTRQILWVFALLTSGGNPHFTDPKTGRTGLEPIAPAQGGQIAWSLNLHHPYDPADPIDSLQVAARAINNIIGGATVTGPNGRTVVQPGLESSPANCLRYTGSAALTRHPGFPALCARPVKSPAGRAALVADVFTRWMVGAAADRAQDAAVLFANPRNPGNPQVQAILRHLTAGHG